MAKLPVPKVPRAPKIAGSDPSMGAYTSLLKAMANPPASAPVRRYEDEAGGSYKAGHPQRIARPSVASMQPARRRIPPMNAVALALTNLKRS